MDRRDPDGWDRVCSSVESLEAFIPLVDAAVREMGYVPRIRIGSNNKGETCLLLDTPETIKQAEEGRGVHGA